MPETLRQYRPIVLIPLPLRIFDKICTTRLAPTLNNCLSHHTYGFREYRRPADIIWGVNVLWQKKKAKPYLRCKKKS